MCSDSDRHAGLDPHAVLAACARAHGIRLTGIELGNGFHELDDAGALQQRFRADQERRRARGLPPMAVDQALLAALTHGLPPCAGVALGFDRVLMLATGKTHIREVLAFPEL